LMNKFQQLLQSRFNIAIGRGHSPRTQLADAIINPAFRARHGEGSKDRRRSNPFNNAKEDLWPKYLTRLIPDKRQSAPTLLVLAL
jgi:hypothetical protein